jgi:hypothetical protein
MATNKPTDETIAVELTHGAVVHTFRMYKFEPFARVFNQVRKTQAGEFRYKYKDTFVEMTTKPEDLSKENKLVLTATPCKPYEKLNDIQELGVSSIIVHGNMVVKPPRTMRSGIKKREGVKYHKLTLPQLVSALKKY